MVKEIFQEMVSSKTKSTSRRRYKVLFVAVAIVICAAVFVMPVFADDHPDHNHIGWTAWPDDPSHSNILPSDSGSYYLVNDVCLNGEWNVNGEVHLCLNGHKIDLGGYRIMVSDGDNFNLYDCGDSAIWYFKEKSSGQWELTTEEYAEYSLAGGIITNGLSPDVRDAPGSGGGVRVMDGTFTMYGGNIVGNKAYSGGGVCLPNNKGTFNMSGGNITGNVATNTGGGVENSGYFYLWGGNITNNVAQSEGGGGVCVWGKTIGKAYIYGGKISNNRAKGTGSGDVGGGGGLYLGWEGEGFVYGGEISENTVEFKRGGGIYCRDSGKANLTLAGGKIINNKVLDAAGTGGGVQSHSKNGFTISRLVEIYGNKVGTSQNNLYIPNGKKLTIDTGGLSSGSNIHVTTQSSPVSSPVTIATGASDGDQNYFIPDVGEGIIAKFEGGNIVLKTPDPVGPFDDKVYHDCDGHAGEWRVWDSSKTTLPEVAGHYVLTENVLLNDVWTVPVGETHLCLNGSLMDMQGSYRIIVPNGANFTICNCNDTVRYNFTENAKYKWDYTSGESELFVMGGSIINGSKSDDNGGGIFVQGHGKLYLNSGNIVGSTTTLKSGGGVFVDTNGEFTMNGGTIAGNTAHNGGGGVESDGLFTMNGGLITGNSVTINSGGGDGGGLAIWEGRAVLNGGAITGNFARSRGGGVFVSGNSIVSYLTVSGDVRITGNRLLSDAVSNVYLQNGKSSMSIGESHMSLGGDIGVTVSNPPSGSSKVNVASNAIEADLQCFSSDNQAYSVDYDSSKIVLIVAPPTDPAYPDESTHSHPEYSGAKWYSWMSTNTIAPIAPNYYVLEEDVSLTDDWTVPNGLTHVCLNGHVLNTNNHFILLNSGARLTICDCGDTEHHFADGDNIWVRDESSSDHTVIGGVITGGNGYYDSVSKAQMGGAIYVNGGMLTLENGNLVGNNASSGGCVYVKSGSFIMNNGTIAGNKAVWGGGAIEVGTGNAAQFTMNGGKIIHNTVTEASVDTIGGGINIGASATATIKDGTIQYNSVPNGVGGGIYCAADSLTLGGKVNITGNTRNIGASNLILKTNHYVLLESLNAESEIGVGVVQNNIYKGNNVTIASNGVEEDVSCFVLDDPSLNVAFNAGKIYLHSDEPVPGYTPTSHHHDNPDEGDFWYACNAGTTSGPAYPNHYVLTADIQQDPNWAWSAPVGTTYLCLNGNVLDINAKHITVPDGATLILCDCQFGNPEHTHYFKVKEDAEDGFNPRTWQLVNDESLAAYSLAGGVITGGHLTGNGGAIMVEKGGTLIMHGGNIVGNEALKTTSDTDGAGGGVWSRGDFILYNGNITGNYATSGGGGVQTTGHNRNDKSGNFTMLGGNITHNFVHEFGGGFTAWSSTAVLYGGTIEHNEATVDGGGMFIEFSDCHVHDVMIRNNLAMFGGGACVYEGGKLYLHGGTITSNSAHHYGGGITTSSKDRDDMSKLGYVYLIGDEHPIKIHGNLRAGTGTIRDDYYLPSFKTVNINNGAGYDGTVLHEDSEIFIRVRDTTLENVKFSERTVAENAQFFKPDAIGDYRSEYNVSDQCLYFNYYETPDSRFAQAIDHHLNHTDMYEVGSPDTWLEWNASCEISPNSASHYVLMSDVVKLTDVIPSGESDLSKWKLPLGTTYLCLNGHVLDLNGNFIEIQAGSRLVLCDCQQSDVVYYFDVDEKGLWVRSEGNVPTEHKLYGGIITNNTQPSDTTHEGGAIHIEGGVLDAHGGNIVGNTARRGGGVIIHEGGFHSTNATIAGNVAYVGGGGVGIMGTGHFEMGGGEVHNNNVHAASDAVGKGGGIALGSAYNNDDENECIFMMSGGRVYDNYASGGLGGIGAGVFADMYGRMSLSNDATIDKDNELYFNMSINKNPIRLPDDTYTGTVLNITGDANHIAVPNRIVSAQPGSKLSIEDVYDQFALNDKHTDYTLAVKHTVSARELVVGQKNAVSKITVNTNPRDYQPYAEITPTGFFYVPKNSNDASVWGAHKWTSKNYGIEVKPKSGSVYYIKEGESTVQGERNYASTFNIGNSIPNDMSFTVYIKDHEATEFDIIIQNDYEGGRLTANKTLMSSSPDIYSAAPADVVGITSNLNSNKYVSCNISVTDEFGSTNVDFNRGESISEYSFVMPGYNVKVNATFGLRGDADYDGDVCIVDAACVGIHIIRDGGEDLILPGTNGYFCADVDGDGDIGVADLLEINRYLVGLIEYPGCPEP